MYQGFNFLFGGEERDHTHFVGTLYWHIYLYYFGLMAAKNDVHILEGEK